MTHRIDARVGETYVFTGEDPERPFKLHGFTRTGKLAFRADHGRRLTIDAAKFERLRGDGGVVRIHPTGITDKGTLPRHINPRVFLDPADDATSKTEISRRQAEAEKLDQCRTLYFYIKRLAESPWVTAYVPVLQRFINENYPEAQADGLYWKPHPSSLMRILVKHGGKAEGITFAAIYDKRKEHRLGRRWDAPIVKMRNKTIRFYWSNREPPCTKLEAQAYFFAPLIRLNRRRHAAGGEPFALPSPQTVLNWIDKAASRENLARRQGKDEARRTMGGRGRSTEAGRALEIVLMDSTLVDVWAVVRSPDGTIIDTVRPWLTLAVDVYSRMIVGATLSLETATLATGLDCLKQIVRRKDHLIKRFPECPEAADCWGRVWRLIVDNGLQYSALSFRVACEYAGIGLHFAPVRTPEYKGIVERAFGTLNTALWHRLPGGIPGTPQERSRLRKDPRQHACYTLEELEHRMWGTIVPILGMNTNRETGAAPARLFHESIRKHGRPTVDDVNSFDAILGTTKRCLLTAEGIRFDNHRFHDPVLTGELLEDMLWEADKRDQRKPGSSGTVWVWAVAHAEDCSYAIVYNTRRKEAVTLPNWDPDIRPKQSFKEAATKRAHRDAENEAYYSKEDMWLARDQQRRQRELPPPKSTPTRKSKPAFTVPAGGLQLVEGSTIVERTAIPSVSGSRAVNVPGSLPVRERSDNLIPPKDPPRGGRRKKPTKVKVAGIEPGDDINASAAALPPPVRQSQFRIADPAAFMASLKQKL